MAFKVTFKYSLAVSFQQRFSFLKKKSTAKPHILLSSKMNCSRTTFNWEVKPYGCDYAENFIGSWLGVMSTNVN